MFSSSSEFSIGTSDRDSADKIEKLLAPKTAREAKTKTDPGSEAALRIVSKKAS
jgi:hypothetical protein